MFKNLWLVFLVSFLVACGGGGTTSESGTSTVDISPLNGGDGVDGLSYLALIIPIICEDGQNGFEYQTGPDNNPKNGKLDEVEVISSASVCPPSAPLGWAQRLNYLEPSEDSICGYDLRGSMLLENWRDDGDGRLNGNETVINSLEWCHGDTGPQGADGLTPIFNTEKFYNSEGQSCSRLSIGYDTVYKNGELDLDTDEVKISNTVCEDAHTENSDIGLIFTHNLDDILKNSKHYRVIVKASSPVAEFSMENSDILNVAFIRITGIFKRPHPDGLVTVHFLKSELQCLIGDQDPRHIGKDTYSVLCSVYGANIPVNERVKVVWQVGPRRNLFELKKVEIFGYLPTNLSQI